MLRTTTRFEQKFRACTLWFKMTASIPSKSAGRIYNARKFKSNISILLSHQDGKFSAARATSDFKISHETNGAVCSFHSINRLPLPKTRLMFHDATSKMKCLEPPLYIDLVALQ